METAVAVSIAEKNCEFCKSGSATLLANYLAKCKRFIAHFSYIACGARKWFLELKNCLGSSCFNERGPSRGVGPYSNSSR
jgi:hypothetical protein